MQEGRVQCKLWNQNLGPTNVSRNWPILFFISVIECFISGLPWHHLTLGKTKTTAGIVEGAACKVVDAWNPEGNQYLSQWSLYASLGRSSSGHTEALSHTDDTAALLNYQLFWCECEVLSGDDFCSKFCCVVVRHPFSQLLLLPSATTLLLQDAQGTQCLYCFRNAKITL